MHLGDHYVSRMFANVLRAGGAPLCATIPPFGSFQLDPDGCGLATNRWCDSSRPRCAVAKRCRGPRHRPVEVDRCAPS